MTTVRPIVKLLRELMAESGLGPTRRREILRLAIETIESQEQQLASLGDMIHLLRERAEMWHKIADERSAEINRLIAHHRKGANDE